MRGLLFASLLLSPCAAVAERVYLDEEDVHARFAGNGKTWACTNGEVMVGGTFSRGVGVHSPSALCLVMDGRARAFEATFGQLGKPNRSMLRLRVYRDGSLAHTSPELNATSGPHHVSVDLRGARWVEVEVQAVGNPWAGVSVLGDAFFEMEPGARPRDIATLSRQLGILTPPPGAAPRFNGPRVVGARPGNPFFFRIPVTGAAPLAVSVENLADVPGLAYDPARRVLEGVVGNRGTYTLRLAAENAHGRATRELRVVVGEKLALTPPMGWNSWNAFGREVSDAKVRGAADALIDLGLADFGWSYVLVDDGWQVKADASGPRRDAHGVQLTNERFPDMAALAGYIHSKGLKAGLYSSPGPVTCTGYEGSWRHEATDARAYAGWGYDFLKYDWCSYGDIARGETVQLKYLYPYLLMGQRLRSCGRDIVHYACAYGFGDVATWGASVNAQCWRTTRDLFDFWGGVLWAMEQMDALWRHAGPGGWNDMDMMVIGDMCWNERGGTRLTPNEQYTHVSMWAMGAVPMILGCDLGKVDAFTLSLAANAEVIDVNQDPLGAAAAKVQCGEGWSCWARPLEGGDYAVALVNEGQLEREVLFCLEKAGLSGRWAVRDLWRQCDCGEVARGYRVSVPGHATHLVRLSPRGGARLRPELGDIRENSWLRRVEAFRPLSDAGCGDCSGGKGGGSW